MSASSSSSGFIKPRITSKIIEIASDDEEEEIDEEEVEEEEEVSSDEEEELFEEEQAEVEEAEEEEEDSSDEDELELPEGMTSLGVIQAVLGTINAEGEIEWVGGSQEFRQFYLEELPDKGTKGYLLMTLNTTANTYEEINPGYSGYIQDPEFGVMLYENKGTDSVSKYCAQIL